MNPSSRNSRLTWTGEGAAKPPWKAGVTEVMSGMRGHLNRQQPRLHRARNRNWNLDSLCMFRDAIGPSVSMCLTLALVQARAKEVLVVLVVVFLRRPQRSIF